MSAAPAHTRTGGGFDIRSVYAAKKPIVESPRVSHPAVEAMFDPERDDKLAIPYTDQGDPEMYTAPKLRAREELRRNPGIGDALKRLSTLLPFANGKLSKEDYHIFHAKLMRILLPKATPDQAAKIEARDWDVDAAGEGFLSFDRFCRSMFELADQWTTTVEPAEYLAFINTLKYRLVRME